ncbi:MAG: InlB B-repeat-containing protein, partial [Oscillospiraceae bacterium]|nr:InlB B-repeat-containing protein [Oscillospiraceae bacterium]
KEEITLHAGQEYGKFDVDGDDKVDALPSVPRAGYWDSPGNETPGAWYTAPADESTDGADGKIVTNGSKVEQTVPANGTVINLYKQWFAIPENATGHALVHFHPEAGTVIQVDKYANPYAAQAGVTRLVDLVSEDLWNLAGQRAGWVFKGWKVGIPKVGGYTPLGDDLITNIQTVVNLPSADSNELHLYAQWESASNSITITRHPRKGVAKIPELSGYSPNDLLDKGATEGRELGIATRAGYTFLGWADSAEKANIEEPFTDMLGVAPDGYTVENLLQIQNNTQLIVYACWKVNTGDPIKVIFDSRGGVRPKYEGSAYTWENDPGDKNRAFTKVPAGTVLSDKPGFAAPTTSKSGYTWDEQWYTDPDGGEAYDWKTAIEAGDPSKAELVLYAHWAAQAEDIGRSTVYWKAQGGYFGTPSKTLLQWNGLTVDEPLSSYTDAHREKSEIKDGLPLPSRAGYAFAGWYRNFKNDDDRVTGETLVAPTYDDEDEEGNKYGIMELFAYWTAVDSKVKLTFDLNGGVLSADKDVTTLDDVPDLTAGTPYTDIVDKFDIDDAKLLYRAGYIFDGWYQDVNLSDQQPFSDSKKKRTGADKIIPAMDASLQDGYYIVNLTAKWRLPDRDEETTDDNNHMLIVTWDPNGGNPVTVVGDTVNQEGWRVDGYLAGDWFKMPPKYTKPGYRLTTWTSEQLLPEPWRVKTDDFKTGLYGTEVPVNPKPDLLPSEDGKLHVEMVAEWEPIDDEDEGALVVRFDENGGTEITTDNKTVSVKAESYYHDYANIDLDIDTTAKPNTSKNPVTSRAGYNFTGWYWEENEGKQVANDDPIIPLLTTEYIDLVAHWASIVPDSNDPASLSNSAQLVYNPGPGATPMAQLPVEAGSKYTAEMLKPTTGMTTRPGWTHVGWYLNEELTGSPVAIGDTITLTSPDSNEINLYAKWSPDTSITVTLLFDTQGGTTVTETSAVTPGKHYYEYFDGMPKTTRDGYSSAGWFTHKTGGTSVTSGSLIEPNDYIDSENANNGGYAVDSDGNITLTLYHQWIADEYAVDVTFAYAPYSDTTKITPVYKSFQVTAGSTYGQNKAVLEDGTEESNVAFPEAYLPGYEFVGWFLVSHSETGVHAVHAQDAPKPIDESSEVILPSATSSSLTLYAHFTPIAKGVTVKLHAGDYPDAETSIESLLLTNEAPYYTETEGLADPLLKTAIATRYGYAWDGNWYPTQADAEAKTNVIQKLGADKPTLVTADSPRDLYAGYTSNKYTITLHTSIGTVTPDTVTVTFDLLIGELPMPMMGGYELAGWYDNETGGNLIDPATKVYDNVGLTDLYARMAPKSDIVVIFDPSDGTVDPAKKVVTFGVGYGELPTPIKAGYDFLGWYTAKDALIEAGQWITETTEVTNAENHTLYAQWSAKSDLVVIFDPCGGLVLPGYKAVTFNEAYGALPTPVYANHVFVGWYTDSEGGDLVEADYLVKIPTSHVLYAHWKALPVPPVIVPILLPIPISDSDGDGWCDGDNDGTDVPKPVPAPDDTDSDNYNETVFPDTGDHGALAVLALFGLSAAATVLLKKRKEDDDE